MAEQQAQQDEEEATEFHVKVKERRNKHVRTRKGTNTVTVRRSAAIDSQQAAEEHVAKTNPGLEVLGAAAAPAPAEGDAGPAVGTANDANTTAAAAANEPPEASEALKEATGLGGPGPSPQAVP